MNYSRTRLFFTIFVLLFFLACKGKKKSVPALKEKEIVADTRSINSYVEEDIKNSLLMAIDSSGKINDSLKLPFYKVTEGYYRKNDYKPIWSDTGKWGARVRSLLRYMDTAALDGLYKEHYQYKKIQAIREQLDNDSTKHRDAVLWTKADILLTDAFMHIISDLGQGRLVPDSVAWRNDTSKYQKYFFATLDKFRYADTLSRILQSLQPTYKEYLDLKAGIRPFMDSMDTKSYTYVDYPYKEHDAKDSAKFINKLLLRISESDTLKYHPSAAPDSLEVATAIKKYQKFRKVTVDGKISASFISLLNTTDLVKYDRIAVTLDRFKQLPPKMPEKYIWVNLPAYYLQMHDSDSIVFTSKIICGKPKTPTPILSGAISDIVIYPTWTVPESIIKKEILPGLKKNPGYLARKGLNLYDHDGELVDPSTVNWKKYTKGIPYKVQQASGDNNALGVIKFNFSNPFDVYLHDTNERHLFKRTVRSLSHGCVRVQEWQKLAFFIIRNDSTQILPDTLKYNTDSITSWITNKEKHRIIVKKKIPLFIQYFSCESVDGRIKFYDDIYGDDRSLKEKYFAGN